MASCRHGEDPRDCPDCVTSLASPRRPADPRARPPAFSGERAAFVARCPERSALGISRYVVRTGLERVYLDNCVCGTPLIHPFAIEAGDASPSPMPELVHYAAVTAETK